MEVLLESRSPLCRLDAIVAKEKNAYYFYIMKAPEAGCEMVHFCWICNRGPAPEELTADSFRDGAPMMPKKNVGPEHLPDGMDLDASKLSIVWYRSGDCAAVLSDNEIICVIPPNVGKYDFPGFSKFAAGQHRYAWALPVSTKKMKSEIEENRRFWKELSSCHSDILTEHQNIISGFLGNPAARLLDIDRGEFPYRTLLQGEKNDVVYDFTAGVSRYPMPKSPLYFNNDSDKSCYIELGFACEKKHAVLADMMGSVLAQISDIPWGENDIIWHGHTIEFNSIRGCSAIVLINPDYITEAEAPDYSSADRKINLLWVVPVTDEEFSIIKNEGIIKALSRVRFRDRLHIFDGHRKFV